MRRFSHLLLLAAVFAAAPAACAQNTNVFELRDGDRVAFIGDTLVEREQRYGCVEYLLTTRWPERHVIFRNLGWSADTPAGVSRAGFDTADKGFDRLKEQITAVRPNVVFLGYGMANSFDGEAGLARFTNEMNKLIDTINQTAGATTVRCVLLGPIRHEQLPPPMPDPAKHNEQLALYTKAIKDIAAARNAHFVPLFELLDNRSFPQPIPPLTDNGIHLTAYGYRRLAESIGAGLGWFPNNWRVGLTRDSKIREGSGGAKVIEFARDLDHARLVSVEEMLPNPPWLEHEQPLLLTTPENRFQIQGLRPGQYDLKIDGQVVRTVSERDCGRGLFLDVGPSFDQAEELRQTILKKNELFFHRWRPQNNTYLFLFRKHEQGQNAREIPQFDPLIEEQEKKIARLRQPVKHVYEIVKSAGDAPAPAKTAKTTKKDSKPIDLTPLAHPKFDLDPNLEISLYAENPLLAKPIQINFDAQGRLWVASSSVYPQIQPGQTADDKILILEDADGDGHAEKSTVFADGLLIPTAVEPGDGGCYVGQSTELLHFKDTDGDGRADQRRVVLSGFGTEDTHHILHTLRWGHDGQLYMNQSIYIHTHTETPHGVVRLNSGGILNLRPATMELGIHQKGLVNSWGHVIDDYGQSFATDGAGGEGINWVMPQAMFVTYERARKIINSVSPGSYPKFCSLELVRSRHFPDDWQGHFITCDFRAHRVVRFSIAEKDSAYLTREMPDVVRTKDVAFRPIDVKLGPDGALYISDWSNPIIQHGEVDFRDPRRDHEHGRIWRVTHKGRPVPKKPQLASAKNSELLDHQLVPDEFTRVQSKRLLLERGVTNVLPDLAAWLKTQTTEKARLEALWMYQALDVVEPKLLDELLDAQDARVRAAAVRVLSFWQERLPGREGGTTSPSVIAEHAAGWPTAPLPLAHRAEIPAARSLERLAARVADEHPRVRVEALRALARIPRARAAELALTAAATLSSPSPRDAGAGRGPGRGAADAIDKYLDYALWLTINDLAAPWIDALKSGAWKIDGRESQLEYGLKSIDPAQASQVMGRLLGDPPLPRDGSGPWIDLIGQAGTPKELARLFTQTVSGGFDDDPSARALAALNRAARLRNAKPAADASGLPKFFDHANPRVRTEAIQLAGALKPSPFPFAQIESLAAAKETPPALRDVVCATLRETGGGPAVAALERLSAATQPPAVRRPAIVALAGLRLDKAAPAAADLLTKTTDDAEALSLWRSLLTIKGAAPALARALPKSGLPQGVAKAGLRAAREGGRNEPDLVLALTRSGELSEGEVTLTDAEAKQLAADVTKKGDPARGEIVYRRAELGCVVCHAIGGAGGKVGPDMTSLGASAPVDYLIESVWFPNKKIKEGYHAIQVETRDGDEFSGVLVREDAQQLVLRDATGKELPLAKNKISNRVMHNNSLMPAGLIDNLAPAERIDLFRFLSELGKPGPFDASQGNVARVWRFRPGLHTAEQFGEDKLITSDPNGKDWTPVCANVDGTLTAGTMKDNAVAGRWLSVVSLYAATQLQVANGGPVKLNFSSAPEAVWVDGKPIPSGAQTTADLTSGPHTIVVRLDPKKLPPALRLQTSDGTFVAN